MSASDMRGTRLFAFTCSLLVALISTPAAFALVTVQRNFSDLVARAEQIVIGTVSTIREETDSAGNPFTLVTLSDLSVLKGDVGSTLTLRFYGGTAGDVRVAIPDMPTFTPGERDLLFVAGNGTTVCPLVGAWQGRFHVRFDSTLGTEVVEDANHKLLLGVNQGELIRARATPSPDQGGAAADQAPLTLDAFRQLIAGELAHPQPGY